MKDFRKLRVWERAHGLVLTIYRATESFPQSERFGLTSQIRRAAASIPTNIAEGCGRGSDLDTAHYFQIALGSASELSYELLLARDLGYLLEDHYTTLSGELDEISKMLMALMYRFRMGTKES